jgi:hypothetical protein
VPKPEEFRRMAAWRERSTKNFCEKLLSIQASIELWMEDNEQTKFEDRKPDGSPEVITSFG